MCCCLKCPLHPHFWYITLSHMLHVWYIYLHDWVILFGQMLVSIFQHHGSHMGVVFLLWYWHQSSSKIPRTTPWDPKKCQQIPILCLVGGIPTPLKNMSSSVGMMNFPWIVIQNSMVPVTTNQLQTSHLCFAWIFEVPSYIYVCMYILYLCNIYMYIYIYLSTTLSPGPSESTTAGLAAIERSTSPGIPGSPFRATFRRAKNSGMAFVDRNGDGLKTWLMINCLWLMVDD